MDAAKPRGGVVRPWCRTGVGAALIVVEGRQSEWAVHRLIEGVGVAAAQCRYPQRAAPHQAEGLQLGCRRRPGRPALIDEVRLAREKVRRRECVLVIEAQAK